MMQQLSSRHGCLAVGLDYTCSLWSTKQQQRNCKKTIDAQEQRGAPDLSDAAPQQRQRQYQRRRDSSSSSTAGTGSAAAAALSLSDITPLGVRVAFKRTLKQLSSLRLAIGELALLAALCAIGTVIEQGKPLGWYQDAYPEGPNKVLGFLTWRWVTGLQLDHIYSAPYFLGLMALLAASLAACSSTRQWPMVRIAQRWRFAQTPDRVHSQGNAEILPAGCAQDMGRVLTGKGYQVFRQGPSLYAFKGLAGRLAPIGVHASMLAIMAGVAVGGLGGWKGSVMVPEEGDVLLAQALYPNSPVAGAPEGASAVLHVNSFHVDYRSDGSISQFNSDLSLFDLDGSLVKRQSIHVNSPLRYKGVTAYQTDWGIAAVSLHAKGSPLQPDGEAALQLPMASLQGQPGVSGQAWATYIPAEQPPADGSKPRGATVFARDFQTVVLYDSKGQFVGVRRPGSGLPIQVDGMDIVIDDLVGSTGLELKVDPGVPLVYAGFAGMMLTTLISYLSHSQVWALEQGGNLHVGGRTNRATVEFANELGTMLELVPERPGLASQAGSTADAVEEQAILEAGPELQLHHEDVEANPAGSSVGVGTCDPADASQARVL